MHTGIAIDYSHKTPLLSISIIDEITTCTSMNCHEITFEYFIMLGGNMNNLGNRSRQMYSKIIVKMGFHA